MYAKSPYEKRKSHVTMYPNIPTLSTYERPACFGNRGFGRIFDHSPSVLFFFKVEISTRTLIPLFVPGSVHNGSAS